MGVNVTLSYRAWNYTMYIDQNLVIRYKEIEFFPESFDIKNV